VLPNKLRHEENALSLCCPVEATTHNVVTKHLKYR
jgi:hypothetical protein